MARIKAETFEKYMEMARDYYRYYMEMPEDAFSDEHVTISKGNKKLGKCLNISLLPVFTCPDWHSCHLYCYAIRSALRFPDNVLKAYAKNTAIFMRDPDRFWKEVRDSIRRHKTFKAFRFQVAGDVVSAEYAAEMFKTAEMFPEKIFWTYTKNARVLTMRRPSNFSVMDSTGFGKPFEPSRQGQFHCRREGTAVPFGVYHCPGNCEICVNARRGCPVGENAWIDEH